MTGCLDHFLPFDELQVVVLGAVQSPRSHEPNEAHSEPRSLTSSGNCRGSLKGFDVHDMTEQESVGLISPTIRVTVWKSIQYAQ